MYTQSFRFCNGPLSEVLLLTLVCQGSGEGAERLRSPKVTGIVSGAAEREPACPVCVGHPPPSR